MTEAKQGLVAFGPGDISESARDAIRLSFNPSGDARIQEIKMLTGRLITICEGIRDEPGKGAGREAAVAVTNLQTASMWAVLAASKGFGPR